MIPKSLRALPLVVFMVSCLADDDPKIVCECVAPLEATLNPEHLKQLSETGSCLACSLAGADLSGMDLQGSNLADADLTGAKFKNANLSGADLSRAKLSAADFTDADLSGALFDSALLDGAVYCGAVMPDGAKYQYC